MFEFHWFTAVPWCLSLLMLVERLITKRQGSNAAEKERRRLHDVAVDSRLQALETNQVVDKTEINGQFKLVNQKIDHATTAVSQAQSLIKNALDHA